MSRSFRRNVPLSTSTLTSAQRFLIITLATVISVGGVAVSQSAALRERLGFSAGSKPSPTQQPPLPTAARNNVDLLRMAGVKRASRQPSNLAIPLAPSVSATKTDSLFTDVDGDLQADPGDTLKYTVLSEATAPPLTITVVNNSGLEIRNLYLSPADNDNWGPDQLNGYISPGATRTLNVSWDQSTVKLVAEDQDGCFMQTTVEATGNPVWTITSDTTRDCGN